MQEARGKTQEAKNKKQETGSNRQEAGDEKQETRRKKQDSGFLLLTSGFLILFVGLVGGVFSPNHSTLNAGGPLMVTRAGRGFAWNVAQPIPYTPDQGPLGQLNNDQAVQLTAELFNVWASVPTTRIRFQQSGQLDADVTGNNVMSFLNKVVNDCLENRGCVNPVIFDSDGSAIDALRGFGASRRLLGTAGPRVLSTTRIVEGFVIINGRFSNAPDSLRVALVHEIGHLVGLDHTQINSNAAFDNDPSNDYTVPLMFPYVTQRPATLNPDDIAAISTLYPTADFSSTTGTITGRILYSDGAGFMGANVIARKVDDPQFTAISCVSGFKHIGSVSDKAFELSYTGRDDPDLLGYYEITGLPPGNYTVEIEPIYSGFTGGSSVGPLDPPATLPGPSEYYSGDAESDHDDPTSKAIISVSAGATIEDINIILNAEINRPPNDECGNALVIQGPQFAHLMSPYQATTATNDPPQSCTQNRINSNSVWYRFTPTSNGTITIDTFGSLYDTVLSVYTGTCQALAEVKGGCNDDSGSRRQSQLNKLSVSAGTTYLIEVTSLGGPIGPVFSSFLAFNFSFASSAVQAVGFDESSNEVPESGDLVSSFDSTVGETEPNNNTSSATSITPNVTVEGKLDPAGDVDFFGFNATQGQRLTIDVDAQTLTPKSSADTVVTLFDSSGRQIAENDDDPAGGTDSLLEFTIQTTGRYFFRIRDFSQGGGKNFTYQARVTLVGGGPGGTVNESEPNNSRTQANSITPNVTVKGTLDPSGDVDFFGFNATAGQRLKIDIDAQSLTPPSTADTIVELFDSGGRKLAENDDEGSGKLDSLLEFTIAATGRYFFSIRDFSNKGGKSFAYQAAVTLTGDGPTKVAESEPNNSIWQADAITPDVTVTGTLDPGGDVDLFSFDASAGQKLTVDINARSLTPPSEADTVVTLLNSSGNQLAENDDAPNSLDSLLEFSIAASGKYFIRVRNFNSKGGPTFTYEAEVKLTGAPGPPTTVNESEPNNSTSQANLVRPNVTINGTINPAGDVDFFALDASRGQQLAIDINARSLSPPSPVDTVVTLYDSNGNQLAENDDSGGSVDSFLQILIPANGRYFFRVRNFDNKGGPTFNYQAVVTLTGAGANTINETEPNNVKGQANAITPDVTIIGVLGTWGDVDFFSFNGRAGQQLTIDVNAEQLNPSSPADTFVSLLDSNGRELTNNNDDPGGGTHDSYLQFTLPATGQYFFSIRDARGRGGKSYNYQIDVSLRGGAGGLSESEPNNSFSQADEIAPNATMSGTINPAGDVDCFTFEGSAGQFGTVNVDAGSLTPPSPANIKIELFLGPIKLAESDHSGTTRDPFLFFFLPAGGNYFIRVTEVSGRGGANFNYNLTLRLIGN